MNKIPLVLAEKVVFLLNRVTTENVNFIGEGGIIMASIQKERIGKVHEGGKMIMAGDVNEVAISVEDAIKLKGVKPGYNGAVIYKGETIGCIGISGDPKKMKTLQKMASIIVQEEYEKYINGIERIKVTDSISKDIQEISITINSITSSSLENFKQMQNVQFQANYVEDNLKDIDELLSKVKQVTNQTKLLGLNASIEAARAGEAGLGFKVVAHEIGKLSENSNKAFEGIKIMLKDVKKSIETIASEIRDNTQISEEQSLALQNISESITGIQGESQKLVNM